MTKVLKYDNFHVTLKIIPLLAHKAALSYETSLLTQNILILSISFLLHLFTWKSRVTQR